MKNLIKNLFVVFSVVFIASCSNDPAVLNHSENSKSSINPVEDKPFDGSFDLTKIGLENLVNFSESEISGTFNSYPELVAVIMEVVNSCNNYVAENPDMSIGFVVSLPSDHDYVIQIGVPVPDFPGTYNCPEGYTLVDTCWSENCVVQAVQSLKLKFGVGDNITVHHGGAFGGISICYEDN